mmetsp:Transcript_9808/g.20627  ORF Transcript_9808/g.20627 Transcript_9808/m.20627 type:complete len:177 (+) Transcript_9808:81-611(+)
MQQTKQEAQIIAKDVVSAGGGSGEYGSVDADDVENGNAKGGFGCSDREDIGDGGGGAAVVAIAKGNDLKTNMGNERTFFKWLFTGLHVGTASTWVLKFFAEPSSSQLWIALGAWLVAFAIIGYGLIGFYRRRVAIFQGKSVAHAENPVAVVLVALASTFTMGGIIVYSVFSVGSAL